MVGTQRVIVHARAAGDLSSASYVGKMQKPYLQITLGGATVATKKSTAAQNPVWDETFEMELPGVSETGKEETPVLHVTAKNSVRLLPDRTIGTGSVPLAQLLVSGSEEARVPLHDAAGNPAGVVHVGLRLPQPESQQPIPSAAGTVLGEVARGPEGAAEGTTGPEIFPTAEAGPATTIVGAAAPGAIDDPSKPSYGILQ